METIKEELWEMGKGSSVEEPWECGGAQLRSCGSEGELS